MIHLIYIYFILNSLVTGYYINETDLSDYTPKGKIWIIFSYWGVLILLGSILVSIGVIIRGVEFAYKSINEYFQISSQYKLKFTKEFDNMETDRLERMNKMTIDHHNSDSLRDKMWRSVTDKVNKRNNYVYKSDSSED